VKAAELRKSILQAAVEGKLVPQDPNEEPASILLERIKHEKERLVCDGVIKKGKHLFPINTDENPYDLPEGWTWCRLNDIYNFIDYRGKTPKKITSGIPLVTAANIKKGFMDYSTQFFISQDEFNTRKTRGIAKNGDVLFTTEAPLGNVAQADMDVYSTGQRVIALQGYNEELVNATYVNFLLSPEIQMRIYEKRSGMTATGVKAELLKTVIVPLPPAAEQYRIANKIEELMILCAELEQAEKELDVLENQFAEYLPKSILQAAMQGKLVAQDPNDEPATELLKRIKQEKEGLVRDGKIKKDKPLLPISEDETPYDLPDGWAWCRFAEIIELISGRDLEKNQYNDENKGIPYITGASALDGEAVLVNRWTDTPIVVSQLGDILLSCKGTVGKIVTNHIGDCHIARQIMALRIFSELVSADYIKLFLQSYVVQLNIKAKSIIPGISRDDVLFAYCPLPPLAEQQRIVEKVDELITMCEELKSAHTSSVLHDVMEEANIIPFPQKPLSKPVVDRVMPIGIAARGDAVYGLSEQARRDADELLGDD